MGDTYPKLKVAAVQAAPVFLDRERTVAKACELIVEAGRRGAKVIGFPEGFVPTHPVWYHFHPATSPASRAMATRLFVNAVEVPSASTDALGAAARDAGAYVVVGVCERAPGTLGTLFNTQLYFAPDGSLLGKHQKLTPTTGERLVHMAGRADTLRSFPTRYGRLSGLICAENNNPLAIFAMIAEGTAIHVSSWPNVPSRGALARADRALMTGRSFAYMAKSYVINACGLLSDEMREVLPYGPDDAAFLANPEMTGGSSIIGPDSAVIAGPMGAEEGVLVADVDIEQCIRQKIVHDLAGHYNRPDVFSLVVADSVPQIFRRVPADGGAAPHDIGTVPSEPEDRDTTDAVDPSRHRCGVAAEEGVLY